MGECHWVIIDGVRNVNFQRGLLCCVGARLLVLFEGEMVSIDQKRWGHVNRISRLDDWNYQMQTCNVKRVGDVALKSWWLMTKLMISRWSHFSDELDAQFYWPTLGWGYNNTSLAIITRICGWALGDGRECFITMRTQLSLQLIKGCNWLMHNEKRESTFSKHIIMWVLATFVWVFFSLLPGSLVQGDHK